MIELAVFAMGLCFLIVYGAAVCDREFRRLVVRFIVAVVLVGVTSALLARCVSSALSER